MVTKNFLDGYDAKDLARIIKTFTGKPCSPYQPRQELENKIFDLGITVKDIKTNIAFTPRLSY